MIKMNIKIENLDKLRDNFAKSPSLALRYLRDAVYRSVFEIENQAVDRNFQFKTPRSKRTGMLQRSFSFGRYVSPDGLMASIGPTVEYAPNVYFGTRTIRPNKFMDRIARSAEPAVNKHFNNSVNKIVEELAK